MKRIRYFASAAVFVHLLLASMASMAQQNIIHDLNNPNGYYPKYVVQMLRSPEPSTILVAAHRGGHTLYSTSPDPHWGTPENSLAAILNAARDGAEIIEVDIRLTSDGVPIVSHDSVWGRETNIGCPDNRYDPWTNTGRNDPVSSLSLDFVKNQLFPECGTGLRLRDEMSGGNPSDERPSTLQEVLDFVNEKHIGAALALDIKDSNALKAAIRVALGTKNQWGYNFVDGIIFKVPAAGVSPEDIKSTFSTHRISSWYFDWQYLHIMPVYQTSYIQGGTFGTDKPARSDDPEIWIKQNVDTWNSSAYWDMYAGPEFNQKEPNGILSAASRHATSRGFVSNFQPVPETATGYFRDGSCNPCATLSDFFFRGTNGLPSDHDDRRPDIGFQLSINRPAMITTDNYQVTMKNLILAGKRLHLACMREDRDTAACSHQYDLCNRAGGTIPCGPPEHPTECLPGVCVLQPPRGCIEGPGGDIICPLPTDPNPCGPFVNCLPSDPRAPRPNLLLSTPSPVPAQRVAYFNSWSVYANQFFVKNLDTQGIASRLTTIMYAFQNIDPVNLTCFAANHAALPDTTSPDAYDGAADAWADYQMTYTSANSVDGSTDQWGQRLAGNFNQLKQLKAKYPHLKVLVSLGGWTYSKYFSDAAATDASRKKLVSSCIDLFIRGNIPQLGDNPTGGPGAAAGVFDGIDIDWEFPGSADGNVGNHYSPQDTANYTALLAEFRAQLNALGGRHYLLTAAVPAGPNDIDNIQVSRIAPYLDFANAMTYDFHGAWETAGPTNFQTPLYDAASSPSWGTKFTVNNAINTWISRGFPADKLNLGLAFYARGWSGVPDSGKHGLYQNVGGPSPWFPFSQQEGVAFYKELKAAGLLTQNNLYFDTITASAWLYDGNNFFGLEIPYSLQYKLEYVKQKGLGGVMIYSLEDDDANSTLFKAATGATN